MAEWYITLAVYAASFAWAVKHRARGRIAFAVYAAFWMSYLQLFLYYSPLCSKQAYEWFTLSAKGWATCIDIFVATGLLARWRTITTLETVTLFLILCHQRIKLDWFWGSDAFRLPVGEDAYLSQLAFASNLACSIAYICMLYQGELNAASTSAACDRREVRT
jgi:hypothetical protein